MTAWLSTPTRTKLGHAAILVGIGLSSAAGLMCGVGSGSGYPAIPIVCCVMMLFNVREYSLAVLQRIAGVYLCLVPVSLAFDTYSAVSLAGRRISVSFGMLAAVLIIIGMLLHTPTTDEKVEMNKCGSVFGRIRVAALAVFALHCVVLACILGSIYGFGYEASVPALVRVTLLLILARAVLASLYVPSWRRGLACLLLGYYSMALA